MVAVYPLRERLWALLMVCLYRAGRQADALAAFQQLRHRLADELGLDPSSELVQLEHDILRHAPALDWSAPRPDVTGEQPAVASSVASAGRGTCRRRRRASWAAVEELERLATDVPLRRLITLTGVGGVGKTRLAVEAGGMVADEFPDGVWLCELAPVAEPAAVAHAVAAILSIRPQAGLSLVDSVVDAVRGRHLLVILDNCEHLLDAAAELVGRVTESCPTVTVLATSREPLGVAGERVWAVPSLSAATEGVRLFCDRAEAADATFSPAEGDLAVIAEICERLDGIPLAIELAAARVRVMTAADLAERLHDRFRLLRGGRRGLERHQTLAATVQWSYRLLPEAERVLFDRLSVFAGGFDLAAAEAVCADDRVDRLDVAGDLAALVDKSMVVADRAGNHARYRLLETLRQFGEERLDETAQAGERRDRHLRYFLGVAHEARRHYEGRAHAAGAATFRCEWANIRAAVQWAITQEDQATATGLLDDLYFFAYLEERYELGDWASQALTARLATPTTYGIAAVFAAVRGDYDHALDLTETGLATAKSPTEPDTWECWTAAMGAHWYAGRKEQAWAASKAVLQTIDPGRYPFRASVMAAFSAVMAATGADPDSAEELLAHAQRLAAPLDNPALDAVVAYATGAVDTNRGSQRISRRPLRAGPRPRRTQRQPPHARHPADVPGVPRRDDRRPGRRTFPPRRRTPALRIPQLAGHLAGGRSARPLLDEDRPPRRTRPCCSAIYRPTASATPCSSSSGAKRNKPWPTRPTPTDGCHAAPDSIGTSCSNMSLATPESRPTHPDNNGS